VKERILALVAEITGYPVDMLDLDLDLEADLGVDTVKQAEVFASIRQTYSIERDDKIRLREFPTLAHVIRFVHDRRPDLVQPAGEESVAVVPPPPTPQTTQAASVSADLVKERILSLVVEKTGYPQDMLDPDLDLEADLGVDTVKQAELFAAIRQIYDIPRADNLKLRDFPTLAHIVRFVYEKRPDLVAVAAPSPDFAPINEERVLGDPRGPGGPPHNEVPATDAILEKVLAIVAEKTGYPKDMLDLDLDLEADLGVDTVKQAEMFAAIRQTYNIPREQDLRLRDFPTLAHVIQFARDRSAGQPVAAAANVPASPAPVESARPAPASLDAANRIPRRVPVPVLRPALKFCKPTGVTLVPGSRVVVMPDQGGVAEALTQQLQTLGLEVLPIDRALDPDALASSLKNWLAAGPIQGIYWLPALDNEGPLAEMDLAAWHEALRVRVKSLYATMRILYGQVAAPGTFLVSATRLGGHHGYDAAGAIAPLGGAVVGFTKTYKQERRDALVKAVDFSGTGLPACPDTPLGLSHHVAQTLIEETLRDPGAVEVGYQGGERWTITLVEQPAADGQPGLTLGADTVFVVTGAAGSIVSAITADLAAASGGTFYLLDMVPEPDPNNPDLARFVNDKEGLKRDLFARIQARGERATPALVEKELAALERAQAARSAIDAVRAAGGRAHYLSVNLTDAAGVAAAIQQVRAGSGRIDVLLHAAGIERSHFLPDKDPREFDLVFDVKSDGWFHLLHAIADMPLGATIAFSSIAGRFGNGGQADYSAANELLCKITSSFRTTRPNTRGIVIDWTAWGGIGMATRGSIPKMMELAGIDMLPPEAGIPLIRRELTAGGTRGEILIGQRLGILLNEWDATGGLDISAPAAQGPMVGKVAGMGLHSGLVIETTLDPKVQPFLHDHQIDGTPVLPGVMGIEAFAEAALSILPGWRVEAIEDVNFLAPFKFYRNEPRTLTVQALFYPNGEGVLADCRLTGTRPLPNQAEPQVTTHFTARVKLTKQPLAAQTAATPGILAGADFEADGIYRVYFHGPAYQVLKRAWLDRDRAVGEMAQNLPGNHHPPELPTQMAPRLIELCEQTAGLWEIVEQGKMGLPLHIDSVQVYRTPDAVEAPIHAVITPHPDSGSFDAEVVDEAGNLYVRISGYRTVALPVAVDAELLKSIEPVMA
jgi:NAD(P)-dependent dehydrogenase (short-subunit alcohol dehydrogenase family)/acyl carrier protein